MPAHTRSAEPLACLDFAPARPLWSAYDARVVASMRARRASWDAIAAALGRATPDVRARFDPGYIQSNAGVEKAEATRRFVSVAHRVLDALRDGPATRQTLNAIAGGYNLSALSHRGRLLEWDGAWRLTQLGRVRLAHLDAEVADA